LMIYKGYKGVISWDNEADTFHGNVVNIQDVITFQGTDFKDLVRAFKDSVDDYLEFCIELGKKPEEPRNMLSKLLEQITPENLHGEV